MALEDEIAASAAQSAPVPLVAVDRYGTVLLWNPAAATLFGWHAMEVAGMQDPTVPAELESATRTVLEAVFDGQQRRIETRRRGRDGALMDVIWTVAPLRGSSGEIIAAIGAFDDLAAVRAAEQVVTAAERRATYLLESVVDLAVIVLSADGRIMESNRAARSLLGWGEEPWSGIDIGEVWHPEPRNATTLLGIAARRGRFTSETRCFRGDGSVFWCDIVLTAVRVDSTVADYILVLRDVTDQREARAKLDQRAAQNAAVAAYAQRAMAEQNIDELARAALEHLSAASEADHAEMLEPNAETNTLDVVAHFSWQRIDATETSVPTGGTSIAAEAYARDGAVARFLTEDDFASAPHLRAAGFRSAAATSVSADGQATIFTIYSRERVLDETELYPLQAIAALFAGAKARRLAAQQLAESETTLRLLFEQVPALIWAVDRDLNLISGHGRHTAIGRSLLTMFEEDSLPVRATRAALRGDSGSYFFEWDGRAYDSRVEPLRDSTGAVVGAVTLSFDVTERTRAEEALRSSREELRRLSAQFNRVQEEERRRIAREVHDELGQRLTALRLEVGLLRAAPGQIENRIDGMLSLIDETIDTVRRVATALRPAVLDDFGFRAAIENELVMLRKRSGIDYTFTFTPHDYLLEANRATALYRIVQEILTNVVRHAEATRVDVRFDAHNGWIYLDVRDNGRGIQQDEIANKRSLGLVGVRERAYAFGGDVLITGEPEAGTHVAIRLPEEEER